MDVNYHAEAKGQARDRLRVGVLSTLGEPLLGYLLQGFADQGIAVDALLFDAKGPGEKDLRLHEERTAGRMPPIVLESFEEAAIPCYFLRNHNADRSAALVRELGLDLLVNGGTPRIITEKLLSAPAVGVLNAHPGLLPEFRGCTAVEWAVYLDEPVGVTVHFMDQGIDEGPVVVRERVALEASDRYVDLRVKAYSLWAQLLPRAVRMVAEQGLRPENMPPQGAGRTFKVIDPDKMREVVAKLDAGAYRYQRRQDNDA